MAWIVVYAITALPCVALVIGSTVPGGNWEFIVAAFALGSPIALGWLILFAVTAARQRLHFGRSQLARWLGIPVAGILALALLGSSLPLRARFEMSRSALEEVARRVQAGETLQVSTQGGSYTIEMAWVDEGGVYLVLEGAGFIDECGFLYQPSGQPRPIGSIVVDPVDGPWWSFDYHW